MDIWRRFIADLEATRRWSLTTIGTEIGLSPQALSDIKQGRSKEPRGMAAVKLHELHARECKPVDPKRRKAA